MITAFPPHRLKNMTSLVADWFTETTPSSGTGISLKLGEKLHEEQSEFQKLEVYQTETYGKLLVLDDCIMVTDKDSFVYHEMMAHPALFNHPNPRRVAIIGGGDCGTLKEVLKHDCVEQVTQIDIDERVTRVSEQYFPDLTEAQNDPRATLLFDDGIKWVETAEPGSLDVIIVDSTDPVGPGEVLFTAEFYRYCFNALGENGIIVQQSESPLAHAESVIKPMYQRLAQAGFNSTQTLQFPVTTYPTGWWSATQACKNGEISFSREEAAASLPSAQTDYYTRDMHKAAAVLPPFLTRMLKGS